MGVNAGVDDLGQNGAYLQLVVARSGAGELEMAKETFNRTKPHVNVGTIGHIDHGKTTTTGAILAVQAAKGLAEAKGYSDIAKGGTVRDSTKTVTLAVAHVEYESDNRHYAHIDCPATLTSLRT